MEKPKLAPYILMALSFIGLADTLFLSMKQFLGQTPGCFLLTGCDTVLHSAYSKFYGVPLSNIGLVFYLYMLALAILLAVDSYSRGLRFGVFVYALIGLLCSIAFEALQAFVIHALCIYCAISSFVTLLLFITAVVHVRSTRRHFGSSMLKARY